MILKNILLYKYGLLGENSEVESKFDETFFFRGKDFRHIINLLKNRRI